MLNLLEANKDELGVTADSSHLIATIDRTAEQLLQRTAAVSVASAAIQNDLLSLNVSVGNLSGHKFPSGIPARRAWLHVAVKDKGGKLIFESGAPRADGRIGGNDADTDAATCEPHYDLITSADQVQIYESVMQDSDSVRPFPILLLKT